jgi:hypothetical protein
MRSPLKSALVISSVVLTVILASADTFADDPALEPQLMVLEGDSVAGVGNVTSISNIAVNNSGDFLVEADTDHPNTDADSVLLKNNALLLREGQAMTLPAGATLDSFDTVNLNNNDNSGWNIFLDNTGGSFDDSGVYLNTDLVIQESYVSTSAGFSPGTTYIGFFECKINDDDEILIMASVDDPLIPSSVDRALVVVDPDTLTETVLFKEGDTAPGTIETITDFDTGPHNFDFNNKGDVMFLADLTGATTANSAIYLNSTILAREGDPAPITGRNWFSITSPELSLNNNGGYVFSGRMDGDSATDTIIIRNGQKFVQEGDTLPDIAPWKLTSFGTGPILISDFGDVLWYGDWDDPNTDEDSGLFLNHKLIMQEGVSKVNGIVVDTIASVQDGKAMSDDGRYMLIEVALVGSLDAVVLFDRGPWEILGGELAGSNGTPKLRCYGQLAGNDPVTFDLNHAKQNGMAHLVFGFTAANAPFLGTTIVPYPDIIIYNLPTDPDGNLSLTSTFPSGIPGGLDFWQQYFIVDGAGPFGYSASNGVKATTQ